MTHLAIDQHHRVIASGTADALAEDFAASISLGQTTVVDVDHADVATLAAIAAGDCPALTAKGGGFLGAGTHPAQPYVEAMLTMTDVGNPGGFDVRDVRFNGNDDADGVIIRFLGNARAWRGEGARVVKARLKDMVKR